MIGQNPFGPMQCVFTTASDSAPSPSFQSHNSKLAAGFQVPSAEKGVSRSMKYNSISSCTDAVISFPGIWQTFKLSVACYIRFGASGATASDQQTGFTLQLGAMIIVFGLLAKNHCGCCLVQDLEHQVQQSPPLEKGSDPYQRGSAAISNGLSAKNSDLADSIDFGGPLPEAQVCCHSP